METNVKSFYGEGDQILDRKADYNYICICYEPTISDKRQRHTAGVTIDIVQLSWTKNVNTKKACPDINRRFICFMLSFRDSSFTRCHTTIRLIIFLKVLSIS